MDESNGSIVKLQKSVDNIIIILTEMKEDITNMKADIIELQKGQKEMRADITDMKTDIVEMKADIVEMKADIVEMKADIVEMKADIVETKADIVEMKADITELKINQKEIIETIKDMNKNMVFIEVRQDKNLALFRKEMNQRLDALSKTDNEIKSELLNHSVRIKNLEEKVIGA